MPTAREIKRRIGSVRNINQVTRALEAVSASAVRKSQAAVLSSRPYAQHAYDVLVNVAAQNVRAVAAPAARSARAGDADHHAADHRGSRAGRGV